MEKQIICAFTILLILKLFPEAQCGSFTNDSTPTGYTYSLTAWGQPLQCSLNWCQTLCSLTGDNYTPSCSTYSCICTLSYNFCPPFGCSQGWCLPACQIRNCNSFSCTNEGCCSCGDCNPTISSTNPTTTTTARPSTTTAPAPTTRAPASTTTAPASTTTARPSTTTAPASTTMTPTTTTTAPPPTTTARPSTTTARAPTTTAPAPTTTAPASTTTAPASTTTARPSTTTAPTQTTAAPAPTTTAPASTTTTPASTSTTTKPPTTTSSCCPAPSCGVSARNSTRIVGGQIANATAWPWLVAVAKKGVNPFDGQFCGGTLIDSCHVLSAAHCFQGGNADPNTLVIIAGIFDLTNTTDTQTINVAKISNHENYSGPSAYLNDIAVLRLANCVNFTNYNIRTICLPPRNAPDYFGVTATVAGWGTTISGSNNFPTKANEVNVTVIDNLRCNNAYNTIVPSQLCAESTGKDSCQGDSGGPLVLTTAGGTIQIGVVSFGQGCAVVNYPGIYARVSSYLDWIANKTSDGCC